MTKLIRLIILRILLGLNKKYPIFRNYYAIATNIGMHLISALQLLVAWSDYTHGEPAWMVRNAILWAIASSLIGWVLCIALILQGKAQETIMDNNLDEYQLKRDADKSQ